MALQNIIDDLKLNNAKNEGFYSVDQLKAIFNSTSIDVPGAKANAITLTYSGPVDGAYAWQVAEPIGTTSNGEVRTIGQTEAGKLYNDPVYFEALTKAAGSEAKALEIFQGTFTNGIRNADGLGDSMSERFVSAAKGPIVSITPDANPNNVWGATELDTALRSNTPSINGILRDDLIKLKIDLLATGPVTQADIDTANKIVLDYVNEMSAEHTSKLSLAVDAEGKLIVDAQGKATDVGTKGFFDMLGMKGMGTDLPVGQASKYALDVESRILANSEQFRNAQMAHEIVTGYIQKRVDIAKIGGDPVEITRMTESLNRANLAGMAMGFMLIASEALAADRAGDPERARTIVAEGMKDFAKSAAVFGGIEAAALLIGGAVGAFISGAVLVFGVYAAVSMIPDLVESIANLFSSATVATPPVRRDPLVFDLNGNGLETTGVNAANPIYFDHNGDGVKTATGWVGANDACLVLDKNANGTIDSGRELFGDAYIKSNGQLAADGFDALRDLDANLDGKVDAADAQFANLRLWRDLNQDGVSQANELFTLDSQNIAAINAASTDHSQVLANGNQLADLGSYVKTDGSTAALGEVTGNLGDINLAQDTFHSKFTTTLDTTAVAALPDMQGAGQVRNLREAASLSPVLAQLLTDFAAADRTGQQALLDAIIKAWSDTSPMVATFTGAYAGHTLTVNGLPAAGTAERQAWENKISLLERFNGRTFNTVPANELVWRRAA